MWRFWAFPRNSSAAATPPFRSLRTILDLAGWRRTLSRTAFVLPPSSLSRRRSAFRSPLRKDFAATLLSFYVDRSKYWAVCVQGLGCLMRAFKPHFFAVAFLDSSYRALICSLQVLRPLIFISWNLLHVQLHIRALTRQAPILALINS